MDYKTLILSYIMLNCLNKSHHIIYNDFLCSILTSFIWNVTLDLTKNVKWNVALA